MADANDADDDPAGVEPGDDPVVADAVLPVLPQLVAAPGLADGSWVGKRGALTCRA
jgi:hypothetical protein